MIYQNQKADNRILSVSLLIAYIANLPKLSLMFFSMYTDKQYLCVKSRKNNNYYQYNAFWAKNERARE